MPATSLASPPPARLGTRCGQVLRIVGAGYTLVRVTVLLTRRYLLALPVTTALAALLIGIPTDVLPNPWFTRMTPVRVTDVILWPLTSIAVGALVATFALPRGTGRRAEVTAGAGGGLASAFAVGCPVCNKLVVAVLGFSGALTYFAPVQPFLGVAGLLIAVVALRRRIRDLQRGCELPSAYTGSPAWQERA